MTDQKALPTGIDTSVAHSARMYDYWLGGSNNFEADRELGRAFELAIPGIRTMARENRRFLGRAIRQMAGEAGIRQFLDIGAGVPAPGDTPSVTELAAPGSRVVCVDNDPIVQAHARAVMEAAPGGGTVYVQADLRRPEELLAHPGVAGHLDFDRPVGLLLVAVLMLLKDQDRPWATVAALLDALPPGSEVALTHPSQDFDPRAMREVVEAAARGQMTLVPRTRAQVEEFFGGWELLEPGVVPVMAWRPEEEPTDPRAAYYWAGVARKKG
ncbi:SAM-dependent methyltransferase [Streptomyces zingiberis]|uniref:SAM-dependent methyltransferase n=1 Tax=Streptomyces zingiberis TaxID=2053010 RepID=A0ABX1C436_9ACTN|nr:SAM-dependent methyltransferase [Streptomyces zingiberis]NJQ02682.1 SAM-dependent methyltransferase [Streptomyces zingiberis]